MLRSPLCLAALTCFAAALLTSTACREKRDVLGFAYAAPATLPIRSELSSKSATAATVKHGQKLSILDVQRRMVKVMTPAGAEGWVDSIDLLSPEQMAQINRDREINLTLPPEGAASAYEVLNIHIDPSRRSPAFAQIPEGGAVIMLGRRVTPKETGPMRVPTFILDRPPQPSRRPKKEQQAKLSFRLPPRPAAPKPPPNWQELSAERIDGALSPKDLAESKKRAAEAAKQKALELKRPVVLEDWTLVRTKANEIGWVLTRNLLISIPDEVAQYAEGRRITSFFELGTVNDDTKGVKHDWLWTTLSGTSPFDFDSWRVFIWNLHRHRYETSFRQRDLEGYFPVRVDPPGEMPGRTFQLITKDDDGKFRRRTYNFDGTRVHLTGTEEYRRGEEGVSSKAGGLDTDKLQSKAPRPNWFKRTWGAARKAFGFGGR